MSLSIVIALFCSSIMLFSLFFIAKVHCSESRVNVGDDFITVFLKDRERVIKKSGSRMAISTYLLILGISPLAVGAFVYFFSQNGLFSILMAFMGFLIPDILLMIIRNSTQKKYEERYARALNQMGSSLRAGLSIARAVEDVAQCNLSIRQCKNVLLSCQLISKWGFLYRKLFKEWRMIVVMKMHKMLHLQLLYKIQLVDTKQMWCCPLLKTLKKEL